MLLYHGSNVEVQKPQIIISNRMLDLGPDFIQLPVKNRRSGGLKYRHTVAEQGSRWLRHMSSMKKRRQN